MIEQALPLLESVESQFNNLRAGEKFLFDRGDFSSTLTRPLDSDPGIGTKVGTERDEKLARPLFYFSSDHC
jgi:hypothetical protein